MIISSIYKSIQRHTLDVVEEIKQSLAHQNISYWSWESRADENELPKETLLGIGDFQFEENRGLWVVRYSLGLSTWNDMHLHGEMEMLDIIHARTGERAKVPLLDSASGGVISEMVVSAWQLAPMAQSEIRNYRTISIELLRTDSAEA